MARPFSSLPQQTTEPSLFTPQVWLSPALTETKELAGGVNGSVGAGVAIGFRCFPLGYRECEIAKCIFVPYYNVVVPSGHSVPDYLVPNPLLRKVVVIKAHKHPAASVVESHN